MSISFESSQKMKPNNGKKLLGRKRARGRKNDSASGEMHALDGKENFGKSLGSKDVSKSSAKNRTPVSLRQVAPKVKKTLIPNVPDPATYAGGAVVGGGLALGTSELIASKGFHRSMIDKIRYGVTVQGVIDYLKTPGNLQFVTKKVEDVGDVCLLRVKLNEDKCMYVSTRCVCGLYYDWDLVFNKNLEGVTVKTIAQTLCDRYEFEKLVDCDDSAVGQYVAALLRVCCGDYEQLELKGSIFLGVSFCTRDKDLKYMESAITPYVKKLLLGENLDNSQVFKVPFFKRKNVL